MKHVYYEQDDVTFRGRWEIDNVAQTPDAGLALVKVMERGRSVPYLAETSASLSGTQILHKLTDLRAGVFRLFFTAKFDSDVDERTGAIDFIVRKKVGA